MTIRTTVQFGGISSSSAGAGRKAEDGKSRPEDEAKIEQLRRRDAEVRAHEAAHAAAAGSFGGGASFSYETGPDGKQYAVGGEVPVRMMGGRTPEEAIRNAAQVRAAALAPANPSAQDRAVAAEAAAMEAAARAELAEKRKPAGDDARAAAPGFEDTLRQLEGEQRVSRGQWRHLHADTGCGSCGKAVAAYR